MDKQTTFAQRQLIIARKDLNMSPGKLAAQVAHGSMAYFANLIRKNSERLDPTRHRVYPNSNTQSFWPVDKDGVLFHANKQLYRWAREAHERGEEYFYCKPTNPEDPPYLVTWALCDPEPRYRVEFNLPVNLYEGWLEGSFTKIVCEAKNRPHLLKACEIAEGLGLKEGEDYFLIKDNCLTELKPEEVDEEGVGRTLTVVGFRPLEVSVCAKISRKFQLYR